MIKKDSFFEVFIGFFVFLINPFVRVKKNRWLFAAFHNKSYREGSKYLFEYVNSFPSGIDAAWITKNKQVKNYINSLGYKCYLNISLKGIWFILTSELIFTTTSVDVHYCFKKKNRKYIYLLHGMPIKKIMNDAPQKYFPKSNFIRKFFKLRRRFVIGHSRSDISMVNCTSDFFRPFLESAFGIKIEIFGMPRNDALFNHKRMDDKNLIKEIKNKFIISYMPTHRAYGKGKVSPFLFENNPQINDWFKENNIILLIKNHPNMANKVNYNTSFSNIKDISKMDIDPQVVIYHTDILITDFSSVCFDYLLLKRPILFYFYDDYEKDDNDIYYDIKQLDIGEKCYSEKELYNSIRKIFGNYDLYIPSDEKINIFHKYIDGNSSKRIYEKLYHYSLFSD
jgi:CDP-glycerol glycerophosphotransferase (TagB/SpsB family)